MSLLADLASGLILGLRLWGDDDAIILFPELRFLWLRPCLQRVDIVVL